MVLETLFQETQHSIPRLAAAVTSTKPDNFPIYGHCAKPIFSPLLSVWGGEGEKGWFGLWHYGSNETGRPDVTVQEIWRLRKLGRHKKILLFVGRVLGHVNLYGEHERGGGGGGRSNTYKL